MSEQLDIFTAPAAPPAPKPFDPDPPFLQGKFRLRHPIDPYKRWGAVELSTGIFRTCTYIWNQLHGHEK